MTLPTFVTPVTSDGDDSSGTSRTVTRPGSGATNGRVYVCIMYREVGGTITASGWTPEGQAVNTGSPNMYIDVLSFRDNGSAPASWNFSWSGSSWNGYICLAFDNVVGSGSVIEQLTGNSGSSATLTGASITTQGADRKRIFGGGFFYGNSSSFGTPSAGTLRGNVNSLMFAVDEDRANAGATGTITIQANNQESGRWVTVSLGLIGAAASGPTVTPAALAIVWSILAPTVSTGSSVTVQPAALAMNWSIPAPTVTAGQGVTVQVGNGGYALRAFGTGWSNGQYDDEDRVVIPVDAPETKPAWATSTSYGVGDYVANDDATYQCTEAHTSGATSEPGVGASWQTYWDLIPIPSDIGAGDFSVEFWARGNTTDNDSSGATQWINGNIIFDRDRFNAGRKFGISFTDGQAMFGVGIDLNTTIVGSTNALDDAWHHFCFMRRVSDARTWILIDGVQDATGIQGSGDQSYPDGVRSTEDDPNDRDHFIVLFAEKHDAGSSFPSFNGYMTALRVSNSLRYDPAGFTPPTAPFTPDSDGGLWSFDDGSGTTLTDSATGTGLRSHGTLNIGGPSNGPVWVVSDAPIHLSAGLAIAWSLPAPTVSAGTGALVQPAALAIAWSLPAPTVTATQSVTATPSALAVQWSAPAPTVIAAQAVTVTPSALSVDLALAAPTVSAGQSVTITPATLAGELALPAPTVVAAQSVTITPATLAIGWSIPAPTINTGSGATVQPSALAIAWSLPAPAVTAAQSVTATPNALAVAWSIPAPTISTGSSVTVLPSALAAQWSLPAPTVIAAQAVTVTPGVLGMTLAVLQPTVNAGGSVTVQVAALGMQWSLPAPTVTAAQSVTITPGALVEQVSLPAPAIVAAQAVTVQPAALASAMSLAAPAVVAGQSVTVTPTALVAQWSVPVSTVVAAQAVTISPATLGVEFALPAPTIQVGGSVTISAGVLASQWSLPAPTVTAGRTVTVAVSAPLAGELALPAPTVTAGTGVTVGVAGPLAAQMGLPAPTVATGQSVTVQPASLAVEFSLAAPTVSAARSVTITPAALAFMMTILAPTVDTNNLVGAIQLTVKSRSRRFTVTPRS